MNPASRLKNHGPVQPLIKKENATTAENAGIKKFKLLYMENTKMFEFKHPKYYKELRSIRNKLDRVISSKNRDGECERAPGPGLKQQASSSKPQAPSKPEPSSGSSNNL